MPVFLEVPFYNITFDYFWLLLLVLVISRDYSWLVAISRCLRNNAHFFSDFFKDGDSAVELFSGVSCRYHTADTSGAFGYGGEYDRPDE